MMDLPGSIVPCTPIFAPNSLEKVMSMPMTYHVGKPMKIEVTYFLNLSRLVKKTKKISFGNS